MADTFKSLHTDWKKAKKKAKATYRFWDVMFTDMSEADTNIDYGAPAFPKFAAALGPNLDNLEAKKNVAKSKLKAVKAAKQYAKELETFFKAVKKMTPPEGYKQGPARHKLMKEDIKDMQKVIESIEKKLGEKTSS